MTKTKRKPATRKTRAGTKTKPNPAAQALGRLGGLARKKNLTAKRASELARRAAFARHGKSWPPEGEAPAA
jgi:hypothetical protein